MSSYRTHALSGAVLSTGVGVIISSMPWAAMLVPFRSSAMFDLLGQFAVLGAISALWPDIDEPNSFASRSSVTVFALLGCLSGSALVVRFPAHDSASASMITLALALIVGALIGALVGYLVPWGIQTIAGGHRRGTHSWLTFLALAMVGCVLLPWIPGHPFSLKGSIIGIALAGSMILFRGWTQGWDWPRWEALSWIFIVPAISAYLAMNFTGASTYTSLSGVKKELRWAVPLEITAAGIGLFIWIWARFSS